MKFADKEFNFYWKIIKVPFFILIGWSLLSLVVASVSSKHFQSYFGTLPSTVLQVIVFGFIGWLAVKDFKTSIKEAAWSGAICGALSGLAGGIIYVVIVFTAPQFLEASIQNAVSQGAPEELVRNMIKIFSFIGIIIGPVFGAAFGGAVSAVGGFIAKKIK